MLKQIFHAFATAFRRLLGNFKTTSAFLLLNLLLLLAAYLFVTTREATMLQVLVTAILPVITMIFFFALQGFTIQSARSESNAIAAMKTSSLSSWKLFLTTLPLILIAWGIIFLLDKLQPGMSAAAPAAQGVAESAYSIAAPIPAAPHEMIPDLIFTTLKILLLGFIVPLASIQYWISATRDGLAATFKQSGKILKHAFAPREVLTYLIGAAIFGALPYFLLFQNIPVQNHWTEFSVLVVRDVLAIICVMIGWGVTVGAMAAMREPE